MSKDTVVPDDVKLVGSSNFHLWKYMITQITKKEKPWSLLTPSPAQSSKGPVTAGDSTESDEEKTERLMYILSMLIKPSLLAQLTEYQEPRLLWNFLCRSFEVDNDSRKFELKNHLSLLPFSESAGVESYFSQFR